MAGRREAKFDEMVAEARATLGHVDWGALTDHHATVLRGLCEFLTSDVQLAAGRVLYVQYGIVRPVVHFLLHRMLRKCPTTAMPQQPPGRPPPGPVRANGPG